VGVPQQVGDVLRLRARVVEREDVDLSRRRARMDGRLTERLAQCVRKWPRERKPGRDPPGRVGEDLAEPVCARQRCYGRRHAGCVREQLGEVEDAPRPGAAELVDRLVRVADHDDLPAERYELAEQADLRRIGVLVFVDEDDLGRSPYLGEDLRVGQQHPGAMDELGVVEDLLLLEDVEVLIEEVSE